VPIAVPRYGVETLATKIGVGKVAAGATLALGLNYASAVAQGLLAPAGWRAPARHSFSAARRGRALRGAGRGPSTRAEAWNRFARRPMVAGHAILGAMLARNFRRYRKAGAEDGASVKAYYKSIWDLFYLEYVLYVFM